MNPIRRLASLIFAAGFAATACAQVPQLINYQGRVAVGTVNFDGVGQFKFALVNTDGTTTYWSNDGTSTAGSEPTAAVALTVTKGLYSVPLGDATLANMTVVPATVFTHADVRLRVWFNDGINGSQLLTPDQRIAAVGYAMMAADVPDGAITGPKIAAGAVGSSQLASGLNVTGTLTGNASTATSAMNADNFTGSLLGDVTGTQGATVVSWVGTSTAANVHSAELLANTATSANTVSTIVKRDGSGGFSAGTIALGSNGLAVGTNQLVTTGGKVGIGSSTPVAKLDVTGNDNTTPEDLLRLSKANYGSAIFTESYTDGDNWGLTLHGSSGPANAFKFNFASGRLGIGTNAPVTELDVNGTVTATNGLIVGTNQLVATGGKVGIGTTNPSGKLHVGGGTRWSVADVGSIFLQSGTGGTGRARDWKIYSSMDDPGGTLSFRDMGFDNLNNGMAADAMVIVPVSGKVGIGSSTPVAKLDVTGNDNTTPEDLLRLSKANYGSAIFTESYTDGGNWGLTLHGSSGPASAFKFNFASGRLGIGTNAPATALDVDGTVTATAFTGSGAGLTNTTTAANYVFSYDTTTQVIVALGTFQDISFSTNGALNGWTHTAGAAIFNCSQTGLYLVKYDAEVFPFGGGVTCSLIGVLNGTEVAGSQSSCSSISSVTSPLSKSFLVAASSGDALKLQFTCSGGPGELISGNGSGTTKPSISCTIIRIQ